MVNSISVYDFITKRADIFVGKKCEKLCIAKGSRIFFKSIGVFRLLAFRILTKR